MLDTVSPSFAFPHIGRGVGTSVGATTTGAGVGPSPVAVMIGRRVGSFIPIGVAVRDGDGVTVIDGIGVGPGGFSGLQGESRTPTGMVSAMVLGLRELVEGNRGGGQLLFSLGLPVWPEE